MNAVMIRMTARPGKRMELQQAMSSLAVQMRRDGSCVGVSFAQDLSDEDSFLFLEHWNSRQDMETDVQTELFTVLLGGIQVLCHPPDILVQTIGSPEGKDILESIRQQRNKEVRRFEKRASHA